MLDEILKLLHPFMPFMTEELWEHTAGAAEAAEPALPCWLAHARAGGRPEAASEINWLVEPRQRHPLGALGDERAGRRHSRPLVVVGADSTNAREDGPPRTGPSDAWPGVGEMGFAHEAPKASGPDRARPRRTVCLPLGDLIDIEAEAARLRKEIAKSEGEMARIDKKLGQRKIRSPMRRTRSSRPNARSGGEYAETKARLAGRALARGRGGRLTATEKDMVATAMAGHPPTRLR